MTVHLVGAGPGDPGLLTVAAAELIRRARVLVYDRPSMDAIVALAPPDAELHVIDPMPEFDPSQHERAFPGRYIFHRALSHDVLSSLPSMDAALIDGAGPWQVFWRIIIPLSQPVLAALAIFAFRSAWNDFLWPLIAVNKPEMFPLPVALALLRSAYSSASVRTSARSARNSSRARSGPMEGWMVVIR